MAATEIVRQEPPRTAFYNDPVIRGVVYQLLVGLLVVLFFLWIGQNAAINLAAHNKTTGFDFLWKTSGFAPSASRCSTSTAIRSTGKPSWSA